MKKSNLKQQISDLPLEEQLLYLETHGTYYNTPVKKYIEANQKYAVLIGGRGLGKTTGAGARNYRCVQEMPGSKGAILSVTTRHLKNTEIPPRVFAWKRLFGLKEVNDHNKYGHFILYKQPPKYFKKPKVEVKDYSNVISFINGSYIVLLSMYDRIGRGDSLDWMEVAEAVKIDPERFTTEYFPAVRGMKGKYTSPLYTGISFTSNQTWTTVGEWIPNMEEEAKENPKENFYIQGTIWDNVEVYGADYIHSVKKKILKVNPVVWKVEYLNQRMSRPPNAFYKLFDDQKHCHTNDMNGADPFYSIDEPIAVSMDFNDYFNCMSIWQTLGKYLPCQRELFVKGNERVTDLVNRFCDIYWEHFHKVLHLYGDAAGNYVEWDDRLLLFEKIIEVFEERGWDVELITREKVNPQHIVKQQRIGDLLAEDNPELPIITINRDECPNLIISLNTTPLTSKFKKDKRSEKVASIAPEKSTHLSDTFDYFIFPNTHQYYSGNYSGLGIATD